jgi:hypothetical protein
MKNFLQTISIDLADRSNGGNPTYSLTKILTKMWTINLKFGSKGLTWITDSNIQYNHYNEFHEYK